MHALLAILAATTLLLQQPLTGALGKGETHAYEVQLRRGESADVVVAQQGVDVIVELVSPAGAIFDAIDGPTGRQGNEEAEILAAESGRYQVRVRPFDENEPVAAYRIELRTRRSVGRTASP